MCSLLDAPLQARAASLGFRGSIHLPPDAMPEIRLTRRVRFSAAHRYHRPEWSEERNREVFGPCANPHGHGHNYLLEVTVAGDVGAETGFSVDLPALDTLLREEVVAPLDHQHLNHAVAEFAPGGLVPTTENILLWIWPRLEGRLGPARLVRLRLHENEEFYVDLEAPGGPSALA
jgi:6-pyruvoyltetrahydropterin/6-carboxytetrahydropterin synthase